MLYTESFYYNVVYRNVSFIVFVAISLAKIQFSVDVCVCGEEGVNGQDYKHTYPLKREMKNKKNAICYPKI